MNWFYQSNAEQCGPVSDTELDELLQSGKIDPQTLVWHEGLAAWQPLVAVRPAAKPVAPALPATATCMECGQIMPANDLITLNKSRVCARCKPILLQRLAEGLPSSGRAGLWREGKKLVTRSETPFPDRCVKCNAPANGFRLKRVLYWQHPAYYLLFLCNLLVLLIVILIVRKKAILHVGLCEAHRKQRYLAITLCVTGLLGGVALLIGSALAESGWLALAGAALFLAGAIWGIVRGRVIAASKIDRDHVWVSGVCREFLDELPE